MIQKIIYGHPYQYQMIKTYIMNLFFSKNGVRVCLHFAAMQKNNFIGRFVNELQIDLYENKTKSTKKIYFYIDNIHDIEYISSIMNYLIKKQFFYC